MRVKEKNEKAGLKLNIQKSKMMAFNPITSWQIDGENVETATDFLSWSPKSLQTVTAATKWKTLAPWKKSYDKPTETCSVMSDSLWPHGLYSPRNSVGQNTGVGSWSLLQGIFPTQGLNPGLPHCRQVLYQATREAWRIYYSPHLTKKKIEMKMI